MMNLKYGIVVIILLLLALVNGCELVTEKESVTSQKAVGDDLIINEVFTISPDKFYSYSWIEVLNPTNHPISWFSESFPATGWAGGANGTICKLVESADSWTPTTAGSVPSFNGIGYLNPDTLYACSNGGKIFRSNDAGETWFQLNQTITTKNLNGIWVGSLVQINNSKVAWAVGDSGTVLRTTNRGDSWSRITTGIKQNLRDVWGINIALQYACGDSVILKTKNSSTWDTLNLPRKEIFTSIRFPELNYGRVVGANGIVLYTKNGGGSWEVETTNVSVKLNSISYLSVNGSALGGHAWAVGDGGTIIKVDSVDGNGKAKWRRITNNAGVTKNLNHVEFVDISNGFAWGDDGVMIVTTNGGESWSLHNSGTTEDLYCGVMLYSLVNIQEFYLLEVYAERRFIFMDPPVFNPNIPFGNLFINPDFIVRKDTGIIAFQPPDPDLKLKSNGFILFISDSARFEDHTQVGPSNPIKYNTDISVVIVNLDSLLISFARWNLMPSSEIRLTKIYQKTLISTREFLGFDQKTLEIVRIGNYNLSLEYPNNKATPMIPEWWSVSRYADLVTSDLNTMSSDKYFYLTKTPIPGWGSQLKSH